MRTAKRSSSLNAASSVTGKPERSRRAANTMRTQIAIALSPRTSSASRTSAISSSRSSVPEKRPVKELHQHAVGSYNNPRDVELAVVGLARFELL